jgi:hypothetical protein
MATLSPAQKPTQRPRRRWGSLWLERFMALLALINLLLVMVDLSYIPFRDIYLRSFPEATVWYGETFKGIEPDPYTERYLVTVVQLDEQVSQTGLTSPAAQEILADLRQQSEAMIEENPFLIAGKSGTLEQIKAKVRDRVNNNSSQSASNRFWSESYLREAGYAQELQFFDEEIRPLMETNYFRNIAFDGQPVDDFIRIDIWFIAIFALDLLIRSFFLKRRYNNLTWRDAILWRWYDLLLLIPFSTIRLPMLRLIRIIPVAVRLDQARLINLQPLQSRISRFFISQIAIELTEVILVRVIDQMQNLIHTGEAKTWLINPQSQGQYIDINDLNELEVITQQLVTLLVDQVLPQIKPELDTVVNQSIQRTMNLAPGYEHFRQVPGIGGVPNQITQRIVAQTSAAFYQGLQHALKNPQENPELQALVNKLTLTLRQEIQQDAAVDEIEAMAIALLEEVKINYVRRLSQQDYEILQEKRYRLYDVTQQK